jgi:hypothetical protein
METVMQACVITRNMIVEDEATLQLFDPNANLFQRDNQPGGVPVLNVSSPPPFNGALRVETLIVRLSKLQVKRIHA